MKTTEIRISRIGTDEQGCVEPEKARGSVNGHEPMEWVCQRCGKPFRRSAPNRNGGAGPKYCSQACSASAHRRRVEFRCKDCGRVELRKPSLAQHERCWKCAVAHRTAGMKAKPLMHRLDPVARENWLKGQRAPERRERVREWMTGRVMETEKTRRGSARHCKALHFTVRTPAGVPYQVDNLCEFVRTHPDLFDPEDLRNYLRDRAGYQSRATEGLRKLRAVAGTRLSWKGWTLTFGCQDELGRQALGAEEAIRPYGNN